MVFSSSVNPLEVNYNKHTKSPYEAALATTANPSVSGLSAARAGFECSTPASPSRNSDSLAAPSSIVATIYTSATHQLQERATSLSPSSDSAGGGVGAPTPPPERHGLGHFSASFPQFVSHSMSPLDPVTASAIYSDAVRGPVAGYTSMPPCSDQQPQAPYTSKQQLLVPVNPDVLQPPTKSAAADLKVGPAPAAAAPQRHVHGFEAGGEAAAPGLSLSPHAVLPPPSSRPRHGSATAISYGPGVVGAPPLPFPGDTASAVPIGMSAPGGSPDHIVRTASLPLLMGNAVIPPGASIPVVIAGVGASGRARATIAHTPSFGGAADSSGSGGAAAAAVGAHLGIAQSVDHQLGQHRNAAQQQQLQQPVYHHSDGGAHASSPAQFVGSVSPSATSTGGSFGGGGTLNGEEVAQPRHPPSPPAIAAAAGRGCDDANAGPEVEVEIDLMGQEGNLICSDRRPREAAAVAATAGRDTDGDEEFEDAVEVQQDQDDDYRVGFQDHMMLGSGSPAAAAPPLPGAAAGSPRHMGHEQQQQQDQYPQQQHRLQRCHYASSEPNSLEAVMRRDDAAQLRDVNLKLHPGGQDQQQPQQHSAPLLPVAAAATEGATADPDGGALEGGGGGDLHHRRRGGEQAGGEEYGNATGAEDLYDDEEVLDSEEDGEVLDGEYEDEEVFDGEEDEELAFDTGDAGCGGGSCFAAAAAVPLPPAPHAMSTSYLLQQHFCVNCTRRFWGTFCRYCSHPADTEVVVPELLEAAVQSMLAGEAAAQLQQQASPSSPPHQQQQLQQQVQGQVQVAVGGKAPRGEGVLLSYDDRCRAHLDEPSPGASSDQGRGHPERPERVAAIMARLQVAGLLARFLRTCGREATFQELVAVHDPDLVLELQARTEEVARAAARAAARQAGGPGADGGAGGAGGEDSDMGEDWLMPRRSEHVLDCYFCPSTAVCARLAAGSAAEVARRVVAGSARHGAAIVRPPGHHAESSVAMGFCYFNNAAVAARAAQAAGARRVLIMDWDVHHGNGTQRIFYDDPSVMYMSTHRYDHGTFYPGTGDASETGSGPGVGFTVNVPWNGPGVCDADMLAAFRHVIVPLATEFRPELVLVSAGFDAAEGDPLGGCRVSAAAFSHLAALLSALAPTVLLLEGGYNLTATAAATEACLRVLLGEPPMPLQQHGQQQPQQHGQQREQQGLSRLQQHAAAGVPMPEDPTTDPWVATGLEGVSDSALESVRQALRVQSHCWLSARDHLAAVEMAFEERRRRQQRARQPQEHWGWHVQMPPPVPTLPPPAGVPAAVPVLGAADLRGGGGAAAGSHSGMQAPFPPPFCEVSMGTVDVELHGPSGPQPTGVSEHFLMSSEVEVGVGMEGAGGRRCMDMSSSGVMEELGEQGTGGLLSGDVHMG